MEILVHLTTFIRLMDLVPTTNSQNQNSLRNHQQIHLLDSRNENKMYKAQVLKVRDRGMLINILNNKYTNHNNQWVMH